MSREGREGNEGEQTSRPSRDKSLNRIYLSFFDKKDLTYGIGGFSLCGMIGLTEILLVVVCFGVYLAVRLRAAREHATQTNARRLKRIKNASFAIQILMWIFLVLGFYEFLAFLFGWPSALPERRILVGHEHFYTTAGEMPEAVLGLWIVQKLLAFWGGVMLFRLFWLYGRGILFSAKNVTCIRFFGWWLMIDWFIEYQMRMELRDMDLSTTPLLVGLLVIFAAWIMDEGRKIQEEQELTV